MILPTQGKSKVIINNKIYNLGEKLDGSIKIIEIKKDKILLQKKKETKWLKLIK